jgi:hypothetical protein
MDKCVCSPSRDDGHAQKKPLSLSFLPQPGWAQGVGWVEWIASKCHDHVIFEVHLIHMCMAIGMWVLTPSFARRVRFRRSGVKLTANMYYIFM